jgi:hypothetical protein
MQGCWGVGGLRLLTCLAMWCDNICTIGSNNTDDTHWGVRFIHPRQDGASKKEDTLPNNRFELLTFAYKIHETRISGLVRHSNQLS